MKKTTTKKVGIAPCAWHIPDNLGYLQWHADASKRHAKGEKQIQCEICKHWIWPDRFGTDPTIKMADTKINGNDSRKT